MHCPKCFRSALLLALITMLVSTAAAQAAPQNPPARAAATTAQRRFTRAFVVDDKLSALRRGPDVQSQVIRRLHLGRPVYIIESERDAAGATFNRVAVTRRTRGWVHEAALVAPARRGDDRRLMSVIESASDPLERLMLCRIFLEHFSRSTLLPRALFAMGEEADRASASLTRRARKRLEGVDPRSLRAGLRYYYLSDAGLDRYSRLRLVYNFNEATAEYVYDGRAYRDLIRRFPSSREAQLARQRLELVEQKLARQR
jgi:hypothetical protein